MPLGVSVINPWKLESGLRCGYYSAV